MVDSGATLLFLDKKYADHHKMLLIPLENPIHLFNIDWLQHRNPCINWQEGTMCLNSNSEDNASEELEIEVMCIIANHMERCHLLVEKVLDTVQDKVYCLAGFTYS